MKPVCKLVVFAILVLATSFAAAAATPDAADQGIQNLINDTGGTAQVSRDAVTGAARFVRLEPGSAAFAMPRTGRAPDQAMSFFRAYGSAFGVADADAELQATRTIRDAHGNEHAVFQQIYEGVPVFGGELRAHFNDQGQLYAANGTFAPVSKLGTTPSLTPEEAGGRAIRAVIKQQAKKHLASGPAEGGSPFAEEDYDDLTAIAINLTVFQSGLVQGVPGASYLAYEVEVVNDAVTIREFVFVDALKGAVLDQISGIHEAKDRRAFDAEGATAPGPNYPGSPFWVEGDPFPTTSVEADNMILASGETYDLFDNAFGRDSFDGAGAIMDSIFNRGNGCPNASWNGVFISFCPGLTTDDITGHEWGHAYTDYTNNLIYQWQSGALNESYSDIWGETVDLINARGLDAPGGPRSDGGCSIYNSSGPDDSYRWLMGEEALGFGGAIRDMWNPNCFGDPGSVTDPVYWCSTGDNGGVHINSGIPNHAFALMVDGGSFNGYSGGGIGLTKAVHIEWAASIMLTQASNFFDNADALEAACGNLIGTNLNDLSTGAPTGMMIDAADCAQVAAINTAVEFRTSVVEQCGFEPILDPDAPALCAGFGSVQTTAFEDFEGGFPAGWTASSHDVVNPGTFDNPGWTVVGSLPGGNGSSGAAFAPDLNQGNCSTDVEAGAVALDSPAIVLPAGEAPHVAFDHWVATEAGWDGGNLKVSVNGAPYVVVPGSAYAFNPYNDVIVGGGNDNPLADEEAFTGADEGSVAGSWGQSQVNLFGLAFPGDTVELRFDLGVDGCFGTFGWYVDDFHVYTCADEPLPFCGDGRLVFGEACDDGNADDGDGCSSSCQVEDGWVCTDPTPASDSSNVVADWSFEGGVPNADWTATSTFGGIAGFPLCGPGNGCPAASLANTGSWLVWVGGLSTGVTSSVEQTVTIPVTATDLTVQTLRGFCSPIGPDILHVSLDGTDIGTVVCDATDGGFVEQTFSVAGFNDGGVHTLFIGGTTTGDGSTWTNFFVDDVSIENNLAAPATPSICHEVVVDLVCNAGTVEYELGIGPSWTVVDNEGTGVVWTDIASSGIGGNFTGGTGEAASVSSDAYIFTEFDTELISNSFDLSNASSASLGYLVNYQNLSGLDFLDVDVSTDGGATWNNELSWNEDHPIGGLFAAPGEAVSIDLAAYLGESDVQVRYHYYDPNFGDWDWYAQVDNVALTCNLIPDCDGAVATPDLLWPPNHKWNAIDIAVSDPDGDPVTVTIDSIWQDEAVNATGSGNTCPDGRGVGTSTAEVRAERSGNQDGRVYHIGFTADDGQGGVCTGEVTVGVPHDQGGHPVPIDGGALFDSTEDTCGGGGGKKKKSEDTSPPPAPAPTPVIAAVPAVTPDPVEVAQPAIEQTAPLPTSEPVAVEVVPAAALPVEAVPAAEPVITETPATPSMELAPETAAGTTRPAGPALFNSPSDEGRKQGGSRTQVRNLSFELAPDRLALVGGFASDLAGEAELSVFYRSDSESEWMSAGAACSTDLGETGDAVSFSCELAVEIAKGSEVKVELDLADSESEQVVRAATVGSF